MGNLDWLATEAHKIHAIFDSLFYLLITTFLALGVLIEYFKWPIGRMPSFAQMVGRALVAAIMLHVLPEVMNLLADVTDGITQKLGDFNQFKLVLTKMGEKLEQFSWSWVSLKESVMMMISLITFFLLYFSVHVCEAFMLYTWTLLYVFSPLLIALFIFPATSRATTALFQSLIEVSCWKIVWSVLATLLWSAALSDINQPGSDVSFVTAITLNLILASTLLLTPLVVHALAGSGLSSMAKSLGAVAIGAVAISPGRIAQVGARFAKRGKKLGQNLGSAMKERFFVEGKGKTPPSKKDPPIRKTGHVAAPKNHTTHTKSESKPKATKKKEN